MVENIDNYPAKKRKVDDESTNFNYSLNTNNSGLSIQNNTINSQNHNATLVIPAVYQNGQILSRFLDRLKLKTVPHIAPLLDRLSNAENTTSSALKSIDKINKRMKEVECHVGKNVNKVIIEPVHVAVGTDITDPNSEEYKRIMSAIPSSPFAPTKLRSSQTHKPNQIPSKDELNQYFTNQVNNKGVFQQTINQMIDLTNDEQMKNRALNTMQLNNGNLNNANFTHNLHPKLNHQLTSVPLAPQNLILSISSQHLPQNTISPHLISPTLGYKRVKDGICLQWDMVIEGGGPGPSSFDIYSFQKSNNASSNTYPWKRIGEVEALPLPMACTLTQVSKMSTYFFAVRASIHSKTFSPWSNVVLIEVH